MTVVVPEYWLMTDGELADLALNSTLPLSPADFQAVITTLLFRQRATENDDS